jgi:hypothetical protein
VVSFLVGFPLYTSPFSHAYYMPCPSQPIRLVKRINSGDTTIMKKIVEIRRLRTAKCGYSATILRILLQQPRVPGCMSALWCQVGEAAKNIRPPLYVSRGLFVLPRLENLH